jgi:transcriptional regulator with XRE-family HTH domain
MIGEKLEEARKSKGISIREAAEATKIRGEYLTSMENNSMDIDLPIIYVRGFLKNYARFLKLDPDKILTDFDARRRRSNGIGLTSNRESFGRLEVPVVDDEDPSEEEESETMPPASTLHRDRTPAPQAAPVKTIIRNRSHREEPENTFWAENKDLYIKVAIMGAGVIVLALVLTLLVRLIMGGPAVDPTTEVATAEIERTTTATADRTQSLILRATDTVTVIVEQTLDRQRIYSGTLEAGQSIPLEKRGPVSIRFTNGSALTIDRDGEQFRPGQSGVGRTMVE